MSRRFGREIALQVLFQMDLTKENLNIDQVIEHWTVEFAMPTASIPFARDLVSGTLEHLADIDAKLRSLAEDWALERMAGVDRNVLRLAAFEILYRPDIPGRVTLNEAIEVAKKFGGAESAKFVNGILDRLAASAGKNEEKTPVNHLTGQNQGKMPNNKSERRVRFAKQKAPNTKATAMLSEDHVLPLAGSNPPAAQDEQPAAALEQNVEENPQ